MRSYPNIETRKLSPSHDYYVAYGGGHVWRVYRARWKGWIAASDTACRIVKGRVLADISDKLARLPAAA